MSKFFLIKYRDPQENDVEKQLEKVLMNIASDKIDNQYVVKKSNQADNLYIGVLNPIEDVKDNGTFTYGKKITEKTNNLPDGSYAEICYDKNGIEFFCDRFESKTIWYFRDDKKLVISNSQRAILNLKKSFEINENAISWFLSSGTLGYHNAWDPQIKKVLNSKLYKLDFLTFDFQTFDAGYNILQLDYKDQDRFDNDFLNLTKNNFPVSDISSEKYILPLSGGNDSRLLFYISKTLPYFKNLKLINWGVSKKNQFDDKKAAIQISSFYGSELSDEYLPETIDDLDRFFDKYIKLTDCRIDHFNAYSDNFKIFEDLYKKKYKIIIRGDIPFTEGLDLDNKMTRAHIGMPVFSDYQNEPDFDLGKWKKLQETNIPDINKKDNESLIAWRDRIYIDFRIPLVISSFNDMISCFIENHAPMMTYSHYLLYSQQKDRSKGDKKHIIRLSNNLDRSKVPFNAKPSIPSLIGILNNKSNIQYLLDAIKQDTTLFSGKLIDQLNDKLLKLSTSATSAPAKTSFKSKMKNFLSENLPVVLKSKLKSRVPKTFNGIEIAYRIVLINKLIKIYNDDAKLL